MRYSPSDFQSTIDFYLNTLGKFEFERIAAYIIARSQEAGKWVRTKDIGGLEKSVSITSVMLGYSTVKDEMIACGYLEENENGFMLTEKAMEKIVEKYPATEL